MTWQLWLFVFSAVCAGEMLMVGIVFCVKLYFLDFSSLVVMKLLDRVGEWVKYMDGLTHRHAKLEVGLAKVLASDIANENANRDKV